MIRTMTAVAAIGMLAATAGCAGDYEDPGYGGISDTESGAVALEERGYGVGNDADAWDSQEVIDDDTW